MNDSKDHGNFAHPVTVPAHKPENQVISRGFPIRTAPSRRQPAEVQDIGRIRFGAGFRRPVAK
jgi:hypothetical protein